MPESTCLHIQDRESGPIRVVELPWISVRIGRAAYCEIRLPDEQVAEEACRLTRRGRTWNLIPSPGAAPILFDGRPVDGSCPLPFDVPFRMGPYCLTLRHDLAAEPDWDLYPATEPAPAIEKPAASEASPEDASRPSSDPDRWRARWKAAEVHLKSRAARLDIGGQRAAYGPSTDPTKLADGPPPRPVPPTTARPARPEWIAPRPQPSPMPPPRPVPSARPTPIPEPIRPEPVEFTTDEPRVECPDPGDEAVDVIDPAPVEMVVAEPLQGDPSPSMTEDAAPEGGEITAPIEAPDDRTPEEPEAGSEEPDPLPRPNPFVGSIRPSERGPRRRRPRERLAGARRGEPSRRRRMESDPSEALDEPQGDPATPAEAELPSVRDILVNHNNSPGPRPTVERPERGAHAIPTTPMEPGHWDVPGWLALPPVGAFMLGTGLLACALSWWWARDASTSAVVTQRVLAGDETARRAPLPPGLSPTGGSWIKGTSQHLAHWAIVTAAIEDNAKGRPSEASGLLTRALAISPLNPTARLAMAQLEEPGRDDSGRIRGLGLSRDSVSLAWGARRLMDAGKKEAALRLYHRALAAAVEGGLSRSATPRFGDDPKARRYFLPGEDAVRDIVAELASREGLAFGEWSAALPRNPTVLVATARLLREQGRSEADALLRDLLDDVAAAADPDGEDPRRIAARAEALCLESRWKEAGDAYREAIERVDNDLIRRSWWFNLADVADRLNDEGQRRSALRAVLASHSSDDIARRVGEIQRSSDAKPPGVAGGFGSVKAN